MSLAASCNVTPAEAAAANAAISQQVAQSTCAASFPDGSGLDGHVPNLICKPLTPFVSPRGLSHARNSALPVTLPPEKSYGPFFFFYSFRSMI